MKNLLIAFGFVFLALVSNAQIVDTVGMTPHEIEHYLNDTSEFINLTPENFNLPSPIILDSTNTEFLYFSSSRSINDPCIGGDFELPPVGGQGGDNWKFLTRKHSLGLLGSSSKSVTYISNPAPPIDNTYDKAWVQWTSDNYLDQGLASIGINLKTAFSGRGVRLGNEDSGDGVAEGISKTFIVTPANSTYYFKYAYIGQHAHTYGTFFLAQAVDLTGSPFITYKQPAEANNPFVTKVRIPDKVYSGGHPLEQANDYYYYRDWTCASLDLSSRIGQQVTVSFFNVDCAWGAHTGHVYLDEMCVPCNDSEGSIDIDFPSKICQMLPHKVHGSFSVPPNQPSLTGLSVTLHFYQNNSIVTSLSGTLIGSTWEVVIPSGMFNAKSCFDLVAELNFSLQTPNGTIKQFSKFSSTVANEKHGSRLGVNNDICFDCCCENELGIFSQNKIPPSWHVDISNLNLPITDITMAKETFAVVSASSTPIREIRIAQTNFEYIGDFEDCQKCHTYPVLLGSIDGVGCIGGGPAWPTYLCETRSQFGNWGISDVIYNNYREITYSSAAGANLIPGDMFDVYYYLPPKTEIPCCADSVKVCITLRYKDMNCEDCELFYSCSTIALKNKYSPWDVPANRSIVPSLFIKEE